MRSAIFAAHRAQVDFTMASNMDMADNEGYKEDCNIYDIKTVHVGFDRNPWSLKNFSAYKQLANVMKNEDYDIVHCNTPIGGVLGRIAAKKYRKRGMKVIYTAHGFHFFKGAPIKNWIFYYPVEWLLAHWTDLLITINEEDYELAKKHMHAKSVEHVSGVGIDLQKFTSGRLSDEEKEKIRESIGISAEDKMLLSVGELIKRKNHESVINALSKLANPHLKYIICGQGELESYLQNTIKELNLQDSVKLLGFRNDISELCECADLFVFPSLQEGLPVALMEAIASKTAVICSRIRGNTDLVSGNALFEPKNVSQIAEKISQYIISDNTAEVERNYINLKKFDLEKVVEEMKSLYSDRGGVTCLEGLYLSQQLRKSIGVPIDSKLILSVGELNKNKNHEIVIRALAEINDVTVHYAIAGTGELHDYLETLAEELGVSERVHLLGYRTDVAELYKAADLYIHPSLREGLPVSVMEAIASKTPVICSNIRGNVDLVSENSLFDPRDVHQATEKIRLYITSDSADDIDRNYSNIIICDIKNVEEKMKEIYSQQGR